MQGKIGSTANFYTHPSFAGIMTREYYILIAFRRLTPDGNVGMNFKYEVADRQGKGPLRHSGGWFSLKPGMDWQTHTWHVTDACFAKMWGFDTSAWLPSNQSPSSSARSRSAQSPLQTSL